MSGAKVTENSNKYKKKLILLLPSGPFFVLLVFWEQQPGCLGSHLMCVYICVCVFVCVPTIYAHFITPSRMRNGHTHIVLMCQLRRLIASPNTLMHNDMWDCEEIGYALIHTLMSSYTYVYTHHAIYPCS